MANTITAEVHFSFEQGITDLSHRWSISDRIFNEASQVLAMTPSEVCVFEGSETLSLDYALSPVARKDPRYLGTTLDQREDIAFYNICWVVNNLRNMKRRITEGKLDG